jgi:hypothetical protein
MISPRCGSLPQDVEPQARTVVNNMLTDASKRELWATAVTEVFSTHKSEWLDRQVWRRRWWDCRL